jgi:hypothetical protein
MANKNRKIIWKLRVAIRFCLLKIRKAQRDKSEKKKNRKFKSAQINHSKLSTS